MENKNIATSISAEQAVSATAPPAAATGVARKIGHYRWTICALLFFATTMNYVDRQILGLLAPTLEKSIGWNEAQYGYIVTAFQAAYAVGLLLMGRLMDWIGARAGPWIARRVLRPHRSRAERRRTRRHESRAAADIHAVHRQVQVDRKSVV